MGVEWGGKKRNSYSVKEMMIAMIVVAALFFIVGYGAGARMENEPLVQCEEDEYLAAEPFTGKSKGGYDVSDLVCIHEDEIRSN